MTNLNPSVWGPHGWFFLDSVALSYPDYPTNKEKENIKIFFTSIKNILPCRSCRVHYEHNLMKFPLTNTVLKNRKNLLEWVMNAHNRVKMFYNKKLLSESDIINYYSDQYGSKSYNNLILYFLYVLTLICVVFIYKWLQKKKLK